MELQEYTFQNLFGTHTDQEGRQFDVREIEIPIIQRDYAQGRAFSNVQRIRNRFLEALYNAITEHKKMTLDFVYGEINDQKFVPLDGQQRLTTLFLLHWYAAKREGIPEKNYAFLKHFTYYTRPSSRDFCQELVLFTPSFNGKLSEELKDQSWFQYQWNNDPTISGMLVMIDAIHDKFQKAIDLWDALVIHPCLSFYFLPISEMGLTDELYVKMNSRGKPLTQFEHFKAEFETLIKEYNEKLSEEINRKFDIDWTDMLFPYRGDNCIIDDEFMRYFFYISDILFYQQYPELPLEQDEFVLAKMLYGHDCQYQKENIDFLVNAFDCWCHLEEGSIAAIFEKHLSSFEYQIGKTKIYQEDLNIFKQCCDHYRVYEGRNRKFPLNMTLLLYAFIIYLQNKQNISESDFQRRIRIVRNLIWNSQFEIRADGQRNNMPQLLAETKEIILNANIMGGVGYNQRQKEEERAKICWLANNADKAEQLFHLEDHRFLYGCISVVGIDYARNFDKFRHLFNSNNVIDRTLIHRALLVFGDYSQVSNDIIFMGNEKPGSWIDLFHPSKDRKGFDRTSNSLNALLDTLDNISDEALQHIIDDYLHQERNIYDWRYYFIKYNETLHGNWGYLWLCEAPYNIYTLRQATRRGFNWQSLARALYQVAKDKFVMGDWAYQGEPLFIAGTSKKVYTENDRFEIYEDNKIVQTIYVPQNDEGIDTVDRVMFFLSQLKL